MSQATAFRTLNDTIIVEAAVTTTTDIEAKCLAPSFCASDRSIASRNSAPEIMGFRNPQSVLISFLHGLKQKLHLAGVQRVEMVSPTDPVVASPGTAIAIGAIKLNYMGARLLMADRTALLPSNATVLEKTLSEALDRTPELSPGIVELRGFKFHPIDRVVPYLVSEYGLSEVAEYLPNLRDVIREGIQWQRLIGTPAAIHKSLRWINHDGDIEEFPATARKWWWFQIHLPF